MVNILILIFVLLLIGYSISLIYFTYKIDRYDPVRKKDLPFLSIIVSLHNEEENVKTLMKSLLQQEYPEEKLEYIFVNDRSKDKTGEMLDKYSVENKYIKVIHINDIQNGIAPKKRAIDSAIKKSIGEVILLTDADAQHPKKWAKTMGSYFTEKVGMVLGNVQYKKLSGSNNLLFELLKLDFFTISAIAASTVSMKYPATCIGTNMAFRKHVYEQLSGYGKYKNIQSGDDDLFLQRVRDESDWKIEYAIDENTKVFTFPPSSWRQFYNQRLRFASKGFKYPFRVTLSLLLLYLFNLSFILLLLFSFWSHNLFVLLVFGIVIKVIGEHIFLSKVKSKLSSDVNFGIIPIASILHIFYVVYFGAATQFQSYEWGSN